MSAFANNTLRFGLPAGSPWRARSRVARGSGRTTQRMPKAGDVRNKKRWQ